MEKCDCHHHDGVFNNNFPCLHNPVRSEQQSSNKGHLLIKQQERSGKGNERRRSTDCYGGEAKLNSYQSCYKSSKPSMNFEL